MKVYELAKIQKISSKDLIAELNDPRIKSHLSVVPADILTELEGEEKKIKTTTESTQTVDSAETVVVGEAPVKAPETPVKAFVSPEPTPDPSEDICPYTIAEIELGCRCLGNKSKQWKWRHLLNA